MNKESESESASGASAGSAMPRLKTPILSSCTANPAVDPRRRRRRSRPKMNRHQTVDRDSQLGNRSWRNAAGPAPDHRQRPPANWRTMYAFIV